MSNHKSGPPLKGSLLSGLKIQKGAIKESQSVVFLIKHAKKSIFFRKNSVFFINKK